MNSTAIMINWRQKRKLAKSGQTLGDDAIPPTTLQLFQLVAEIEELTCNVSCYHQFIFKHKISVQSLNPL